MSKLFKFTEQERMELIAVFKRKNTDESGTSWQEKELKINKLIDGCERRFLEFNLLHGCVRSIQDDRERELDIQILANRLLKKLNTTRSGMLAGFNIYMREHIQDSMPSNYNFSESETRMDSDALVLKEYIELLSPEYVTNSDPVDIIKIVKNLQDDSFSVLHILLEVFIKAIDLKKSVLTVRRGRDITASMYFVTDMAWCYWEAFGKEPSSKEGGPFFRFVQALARVVSKHGRGRLEIGPEAINGGLSAFKMQKQDLGE